MKRAGGSTKKKAAAAAADVEQTAIPLIIGGHTPVVASAPEIAAAAAAAAAPVPEPEVQTKKPAAPRKREAKKKQFPVVAIVTPDGIEGTFIPEMQRPLIAHIPIHSAEVLFHDAPVSYDPTPPCEAQPFDSAFDTFQATDNDFAMDPNSKYEVAPETVQTLVEKEDPKARENQSQQAKPLPVYYKGELNITIAGPEGKLPDSTDTACMWCCHTFEGQPCIIPMREIKGVWEVYGNFCCPECALAYMMDERDDSHVRWEKVALLHRLYSDSVCGRIYPAPARITLKMFGGALDIDTYRATVRARKVRVDIHVPPMASILATMDTKPIDFYETTIHKTFVPLNNERMQKAEEGLRLKRLKPLKDKESTLDACMNLQIRRMPIAAM
jgi:hypothetical protein